MTTEANRPRPRPCVRILALSGLAAMSACSGAQTARTGPPAPGWFASPPTSSRSLYFVGSTSGAPDEQMARDLAIQKALSELTVYCGANIKSDFQSEEVERNGELTQSVSLTVDVAGDELTIREAVVKKSTTGPASDGSWDAYALLEWPKSQYERVLASKRDRAERALALFLEAESSAAAMRLSEANTKLGEAKQILGPMKAQIPLRHATYKNSALLWDAVSALKSRLTELEKERRKVFHVAVECSREGKPAGCPPHRVGGIRQRVSSDGFKVSAAPVEASVAREILTSSNPKTDASLRSAGFVLAVHYDAQLTAKEDGFTFVHCGARGVVYDTDANRIVSVHEVKPQKGGHVHYNGAMEKGCGKAEASVVKWIDETLPTFQ